MPQELKAAGVGYKKGVFPFLANSRARAVGSAEGLVKMLACDKTDRILAVSVSLSLSLCLSICV